MPSSRVIPAIMDRAAARGENRTRGWRRFPARSGVRAPAPKPESYQAEVTFTELADEVMMEVAVRNRTGSPVRFEVLVHFDRSWIEVEGNSHGTALYPVNPRQKVSVRVEGSAGPILYEGTVPADEEADHGTTQPLPGGEPREPTGSFYGGPDPDRAPGA